MFHEFDKDIISKGDKKVLFLEKPMQTLPLQKWSHLKKNVM